MRQLRGNPRTGRRVAGTLDSNLTVLEAMAIRADEARLAAYCARRAEQARAVAQYGAGRHWTQEYRRAATQCRVLGERIRRVSGGPPVTGARPDSTVAVLTPRPALGVPPTGEAASGVPPTGEAASGVPPTGEAA